MKSALEQVKKYCSVLILVWSSASCSNNLAQDSEKHISNTESTTSTVIQNKTVEHKASDFTNVTQFYEVFSKAVESDDWRYVSNLTEFPFTFRGQLDFEGEIQVNKQEFIRIFPHLLELEAIISIAGESFQTTYRGLIMTPISFPESGDVKEINFHDFIFKKNNGKWKLSTIYMDLNNLEMINLKKDKE